MKPIIASHTFLDTFERCPKQAWHKYVAKDLPFVETEQMRWGTRVHTALEHRVRDKTPLPEGMEPYEKFAAALDPHKCHVETKLGMTVNGRGAGFFADNVWCRGKVDVATTQGPVCFILDWKTGKPREDEAELERFAYMLRANNDELKYFTGRYVWLKEDRLGEEHVLDPDKRLANDKRLMDQVDVLQKRQSEWPAHENGLCRAWCDVLTCAHNGRK
jgi:hypothetical protein